jgi:recombinational DNA repair protein RecR
MAALPDPVVALVNALSRLPGIGPRSAERLALVLVQADRRGIQGFVRSASCAQGSEVRFCDFCGALTEISPCGLCSDHRREASLICVVERAVDILSLEKSGTFRENTTSWEERSPPWKECNPKTCALRNSSDDSPPSHQGTDHRSRHRCGRRRHLVTTWRVDSPERALA